MSTIAPFGAVEMPEVHAVDGGIPTIGHTVGTYDEYDSAALGGHLGKSCRSTGARAEETDVSVLGEITEAYGGMADVKGETAVSTTYCEGVECSVMHGGDEPHVGYLVSIANVHGKGKVHPAGILPDEIGTSVPTVLTTKESDSKLSDILEDASSLACHGDGGICHVPSTNNSVVDKCSRSSESNGGMESSIGIATNDSTESKLHGADATVPWRL